MQQGPAPDRFLVGLATLGVLCNMAEDGTLVCLIDDAQWLDRASIQVLAFIGRRLAAERFALVFAVREPSAVLELDGLPELVIEGLGDHHARRLLEYAVTGRLDEQVRDRIVALSMVQWTIGAILGLVVATLVPGFAARLLHVRAEDAVFIMAPAGVGMVLGTALLNRWGDRLGPNQSVGNAPVA
jgi:hypothetical protein